MALDIPRIEMKLLERQLRIDVAWEVDDMVREPPHLARFREQIKVCNAMVTAYEEAFEERERRKKERREALRAKYAKEIARIKRCAKYSGDEAPGEGYVWMEFLAADTRRRAKRRPERQWDRDFFGWVKPQDDGDRLKEDDVFPESDLPPKAFPAPRVIVTGQRTDSRPPEVDEYLPGYYWMLAAIHDTTLEQRPQIITERKGLHESLAFELRASDTMQAPPYTYEHVGCALDDVRADLARLGAQGEPGEVGRLDWEKKTAPPAPPTPPADETEDNAWLSHKDIATRFGVPHDALKKRLARWRRANLEGWNEVSDPRPREAWHLYRVGAVRPIIEDLASRQMSRQCPAKKKRWQ
jgi:hypothetical protein